MMKNLFTHKYKIISFLLVIAPFVMYSQVALQTKLKGRNTLSEIMTVVDEHYKGKPANWIGEGQTIPRLKQWKRWEWYMANRLGPDGEFVDINQKNLDAYEKYKSANRTINDFWVFIGPSSIDGFGVGRADRIAFHPTLEDTYYVGSSGGGLWRTTNDGVSWTPLTDFIASVGISGVVVSWADPNDIYILTGDGDSDLQGGLVDQFDYERNSAGVYKSTDAGATWTKTGILDTLVYLPFQLVMNPTNANVLLAATSKGIYRTINGGNTWTRETVNPFFDVEYKPNTNRAYAAGINGAYFSPDGGDTWNQAFLNIPLDNTMRLEIAVTPAAPNNVYLFAGCDSTDAGEFGGFYKSTDSGVNYMQLSNSPNILGKDNDDGEDDYQQPFYTHCMAVSSANANKVVTGAVYSWRSGDGGVTWVPADGPHPDHHMIAYNPLNDDVYSCDDGGVYRSTDDGATWTSLVNNFEASQIYHLVGTEADPDYLLAGLQDNGVIQRTSTGSDFDELLYLDGFMLAYAPNSLDTLYAGGNREIYRFRDGGIDGDSITPLGPDDKEFFGNVLTHINDEDIVLAGFSSIFKSFDQGDSWFNAGGSGNWAMTSCPSNQNRMYAAGGPGYTPSASGKVWVSNNHGLSWDSIHANPGFPDFTSGTKITDIGVNPENSAQVFVTFGGFTDGIKVYRSISTGSSWTDWSGSLPNVPINCIAVDHSQNVYVGTDIGVFYRSQTMDDWMPYKNGLPNVPVTEFVLDESNNYISCSTFGRGIWRNDLVEECPVSFNLSGNQTGYRLWQTSDFITSNARVVGSENSNVHLQAGNYIVMNPGFKAERHSSFSARIGECGGGGIPVNDDDEVKE